MTDDDMSNIVTLSPSQNGSICGIFLTHNSYI